MTFERKKIIFTATIAGITLFTVYKVTKEKRTYTEVPLPDEEPKKSDTENKKTFDTVKKNVIEKVNKLKAKIEAYAKKIVKFLSEYADEMEGIKQAITLAASIVTLKNVMQKSRPASIGDKSPTPLLGAHNNAFDIKNGDVLIGEWDTTGQYLHFSIV